ncbi:hypothetical protein [Micromonospora sp. LOL_023]|uniref:hypothetical protein n=1 Tax=Micromonospora sp. LOL_023 TaxID=3345418 RepID=UPI003A838E2D
MSLWIAATWGLVGSIVAEALNLYGMMRPTTESKGRWQWPWRSKRDRPIIVFAVTLRAIAGTGLAAAAAAGGVATTTSVPLPTRTRLAAALAARPVVNQPATMLNGTVGVSAGLSAGDKLAGQVKAVVAALLGTPVDQLRLDSDGDIGVRAGSAMILVRPRRIHRWWRSSRRC